MSPGRQQVQGCLRHVGDNRVRPRCPRYSHAWTPYKRTGHCLVPGPARCALARVRTWHNPKRVLQLLSHLLDGTLRPREACDFPGAHSELACQTVSLGVRSQNSPELAGMGWGWGC